LPLTLLKRILITALAAGFIAGLFMSAIQARWVIPLIEQAEAYEFCTPDLECPPGAALKDAMPVERLGYTALFNILSGVAFGLLLTAGYALRGEPISWKQGIVWGLAGFAAFSLAPALGLPPAPPGSTHMPLQESQLWWLACAAATAAGLALLAFGNRRFKLLGVAAMILPHAVGAPLPIGDNTVPAEVVVEFITASLVTTGLFWLALGGLSGFVYCRLSAANGPD